MKTYSDLPLTEQWKLLRLLGMSRSQILTAGTKEVHLEDISAAVHKLYPTLTEEKVKEQTIAIVQDIVFNYEFIPAQEKYILTRS